MGVTGGRDYTPSSAEEAEFTDWFFNVVKGTLLIHGACCDRDGNLRGVDAWAERWAIRNEVDYIGMPARWKQDGGRRAGPMRNRRMASKLDALAGFKGGSGTQDCIDAVRAAGKLVREIGR